VYSVRVTHPLPLSFKATVISGAGRGHRIGTPTMNVNLADVPMQLREGIYACAVPLEGVKELAVMHYGPRPVFKDTLSCEVHLLDRIIVLAPEVLDIEVIAYLREVRDFASVEALQAQIAADISDARGILNAQ
jgi:riboflavin kinase/FMN adenylyltransferase